MLFQFFIGINVIITKQSYLLRQQRKYTLHTRKTKGRDFNEMIENNSTEIL